MTMAPAIQFPALLCCSNYSSFSSLPPSSLSPLCRFRFRFRFRFQSKSLQRRSKTFPNKIDFGNQRFTISTTIMSSSKGSNSTRRGDEDDDNVRNGLVRTGLWVLESVYIFWLFLLPYAPGDPVWAISSDTINSLVGLSLNFFFILPLSNSVGIHLMEAPVLNPMSEGLFNFVVGWTLMFAPLLYTDLKRDRYKGSLDVLWGLQMFLTNTFLIPYMAIRLNQADEESYPKNPSQLGATMIKGAPTVGLIGGVVCVISILWALFGRMDAGFGSVTDRWDFLLSYLASERFAYAFIWDIVLYTIFQPWLIGENLANVQEKRVDIMNYIRYIPVVGLVAYLLCLDRDRELYMVNRNLDD